MLQVEIKRELKKLEENYQVKSYSINIEEEIEIEKFLEDIEDEENRCSYKWSWKQGRQTILKIWSTKK